MATKKKAQKPAAKAVKLKPMNVAEWLTSFSAFLTTREKPIIFSARHDASAAAEITGKYIAANKLAPVRDNWGKMDDGIKHAVQPPDTDHITNLPGKSVAAEPVKPADAANRCLGILGELPHDDQNAALAVIFRALKIARENRLSEAESRLNGAQYLQQLAQKSQRDLENVGLGLFSVFQP